MTASSVWLTALATGLVAFGLSGVAQQPSFTTSSDLVVVPAVVLDRKGALVRGLDAGSFQLFEDGETCADRDIRGA
jgi:hypothetical protein